MTKPDTKGLLLPRVALGAGAVMLPIVTLPVSAPDWLRAGAWIAAIAAIGLFFFLTDEVPTRAAADRRMSWVALGIVLAVAITTRTALLGDLPQGAYIDEVYTMRNTLGWIEKPFDLFGQTPLMKKGWVETSNLYLAFNSVIVRIFGVSYITLKLFSVIPGVATCAFFYLACTRLFSPRLALLVALPLALSHWHIRLSRYGWDASFMVMTTAAAIWLLLAALECRPGFFAFLSGLAVAAGLYAYIAGRMSLISLGGYLVIAALFFRRKEDRRRLLSFAVGAAIVATPLLAYAVRNWSAMVVRVGELSIFSQANWFLMLLNNVWWHALMFHVKGSVYARDNYPGLPMLDPVTGLLMLGGLAVIVFRRRDRVGLLMLVLLAGIMSGAIFSVSQEGPPYVYRACAVVLPTMLIAGLGLEALLKMVEHKVKPPRAARLRSIAVGVSIVSVVAVLNILAYFLLESRNVSARRVMGEEYRLMGEAVSSTDMPVYLLVPGVYRTMPNKAQPGESHFEANHDMPYGIFGGQLTELAMMYFSGRYDCDLTQAQNYRRVRIYAIHKQELEDELPLPAAILIHESDASSVQFLHERYSGANIQDEPIIDTFGKERFILVKIRA